MTTEKEKSKSQTKPTSNKEESVEGTLSVKDKTGTPQTEKEKTDVDDYIDEHFPKGKDKRRGEVLVVNALAQIKGKSETISNFAEKIKKELRVIVRELKEIKPEDNTQYQKILLQLLLLERVFEIIDKLVEEQTSGELTTK